MAIREARGGMDVPPSPAVHCLTENKYKFRYYN